MAKLLKTNSEMLLEETVDSTWQLGQSEGIILDIREGNNHACCPWVLYA